MRCRALVATSICALLLAAALLTACGSDKSATGEETPSSNQTTAEQNKSASVAGKTMFLVGPGDVNPWSKAFNHTIVDELTGMGAKVTYLQDPYDVQTEVANLNRAIAAKPDAILLLGLSYDALAPGMARAHAANIKILNLSSPARPAQQYVTKSFESDNAALGKFAGQNVIDGLKAQGKTSGNVIAITGTAALSQTTDRMDAFKGELAKVPGLKLVAVEDGNFDQATSQKLAQQLFAKYRSKGGIQAAYGMADNQALGIITAAKQAGLNVGGKDGLVVTGSNCYKAGLEAIKGGEMYGTGTLAPTQEAKFAVENVVKFFAGDDLPDRVFSPETRVTRDNVQQILDANVCP